MITGGGACPRRNAPSCASVGDDVVRGVENLAELAAAARDRVGDCDRGAVRPDRRGRAGRPRSGRRTLGRGPVGRVAGAVQAEGDVDGWPRSPSTIAALCRPYAVASRVSESITSGSRPSGTSRSRSWIHESQNMCVTKRRQSMSSPQTAVTCRSRLLGPGCLDGRRGPLDRGVELVQRHRDRLVRLAVDERIGARVRIERASEDRVLAGQRRPAGIGRSEHVHEQLARVPLRAATRTRPLVVGERPRRREQPAALGDERVDDQGLGGAQIETWTDLEHGSLHARHRARSGEGVPWTG